MNNLPKALAFMALLWLAMAGLAGLLFPAPALVGYGCEGAGGVIYAHEESDFPYCERIEAL